MNWGSSATFQAPAGWREYLASIQTRSFRLIDLGIWAGVDPMRLGRWLKNFKTPEERYFAACVLDALTFRNAAQTKALMLDLFERRLPQALPLSELPFLNWLKNPAPPATNFHAIMVPVISDKESPAKSGPLLTRMYRRDLEINQGKMIWPWQIQLLKRPPKMVLFVDDFLGTGSQFDLFIQRFGIDKLIGVGSTRWIYAPLVAHEKGLGFLRKKHPGLSIVFAENLDERCDLFSKKHSVFADGVNSRQAVLDFYDGLAATRLIRVAPQHRRGYHAMGLAFAFAHATPDNSLPIFRETSPKWAPLVHP